YHSTSNSSSFLSLVLKPFLDELIDFLLKSLFAHVCFSKVDHVLCEFTSFVALQQDAAGWSTERYLVPVPFPSVAFWMLLVQARLRRITILHGDITWPLANALSWCILDVSNLL